MEVHREAADWDVCAVEDPDDPELLDLTPCALDPRTCPGSTMDITRCMGGAPVVMSSPYFFQSPEFLRTDLKVRRRQNVLRIQTA